MTKQKRTRWTTELIDEFLKETYPWVYLIPGQKYVNAHTNMWFYCTTPGHPPYKARLSDILNPKHGCQCTRCKDDKSKARKYEITKAYVGVTNIDGMTILEHTRYHQRPSDKKRGILGIAVYRYRCGVCGNENATAVGDNLKKPGHITHCGCLGKRDGRLTFGRNHKKAESPCFFYIFSTVNGLATKIGISKNIKHRASESYEQELFVSAAMPRANCWAVEQVMLHQLRKIGMQFDLSDIPAFEEGKESGGSEVLVNIGLDKLIQLYQRLAMDCLALGWEGLLDAYIDEPDMNMYQRLRWNKEQMEVVSGENYKGLIYNSIFDI